MAFELDYEHRRRWAASWRFPTHTTWRVAEYGRLAIVLLVCSVAFGQEGVSASGPSTFTR
ncbi:hypothetical protein M433DRAFT_157015 [Acidomyces richmondensis BFW]|nr:hypothetical protein M433DRAFT_161246 [Acidomyces richmondensis BFW]KYG43218.1 hypothetical protein M433DRAFT_157015 [Acidomyces richmondensis BFW]